MLGRIALFLSVLYVLLNTFLLRWAAEKIPHMIDDDEEHFNATLKKLLKPRYVGSPGHSEVGDFIEQELLRLDLMVARHDFQMGANFTNLAGILNHDAEHLLILTCHYDSQAPTDGVKEAFLGATEGAVSCAILLNVAKTLRTFFKDLSKKKGDMGLALIFFDGNNPLPSEPEEENGLKGSRSFVDAEYIPFPAMAATVTLGFIGAPNQTFVSQFEDTNDLFNVLADIETDLRNAGELADCHVLFQKEKQYDNDQIDDHLIFEEFGVPVMHLAPQEFPKVLYTADDNAENLHWPTIRNMNKIIRRFVYHFCELWGSYVFLRDRFVSYYDLDND
ncbi:glutaminyl-peptide cyclotransferase [Drosophila ficusphila]|uniref:glutaminyl-peptide cyclotransferase n=1 Tax=Drosophila ficusphila TaxID=30025 RepID=UPI0007E7BC75|nr:glutaminyl-peptide cyclotransferase [Drosophila ficusphila]